jgi:hypothetical protein
VVDEQNGELGKKKCLTAVFLLAIFGMLLVEPCVAPITTPTNPKAGPEIASVEIRNNPIILPPAYTTDPYTGETHQIFPESRAPNGSIVITIKNSPFTPYTDKDNNYINRFYSFRWKSSNDQWSNIAQPYCVYQSDSAYTVVTFTYGTENETPTKVGYYGYGDSIDFRIQSVLGYFELNYKWGETSVYEGEGSKWTEITLEIPSMGDKAGTSEPNIKPTSVMPSTSDSSNPSHQTPWTPDLLIIIFVTVCIITIPIVVTKQALSRKFAKSA